MGLFTPRTPRSRQGAWASRRDRVRQLLIPAEVADARPGADGKLVTLLGSGEPPKSAALPTSVKFSSVPAPSEMVASVYHWRPIQVREHEQRTEMSYTVGTYVNTLAMPVLPRTFEDGWITGVSSREVEGFVDLSAVRFCIGRGISLMDEVSLHTIEVGDSRMVTLQGTISEKFFMTDGGKPLALLPESCRPPRELFFVVAGTSPGGFHLLQVRTSRGFGVGGDLIWRDSTWNRDCIHLTGVMYEVGTDAMRCATLDSTWTGESLQVFVTDFQHFLIRKFGSIEDAWKKAFDLDGNGSINFTEFGLGCKSSGYVGNATRLWAALDEDRSGEISLEELFHGLQSRRPSALGDAALGPAADSSCVASEVMPRADAQETTTKLPGMVA